MEVSIDDFVSVFEEADTFAMWSVDLGFPEIDNFIVFEEFRGVEGGLSSEDQRRAIFDNKQLLQFQLDIPEFPANERSLIVEVIKVKLCFFQHFFLTILINFQLAAHPADENIKGLIHFFNGLEFTAFDLFQRILSEKDRLTIRMEFFLFADITLYDRAVTFMEICQYL